VEEQRQQHELVDGGVVGQRMPFAQGDHRQRTNEQATDEEGKSEAPRHGGRIEQKQDTVAVRGKREMSGA
jgi:hypothetical protein